MFERRLCAEACGQLSGSVERLPRCQGRKHFCRGVLGQSCLFLVGHGRGWAVPTSLRVCPSSMARARIDMTQLGGDRTLHAHACSADDCSAGGALAGDIGHYYQGLEVSVRLAEIKALTCRGARRASDGGSETNQKRAPRGIMPNDGSTYEAVLPARPFGASRLARDDSHSLLPAPSRGGWGDRLRLRPGQYDRACHAAGGNLLANAQHVDRYAQ
jgi:hypothetical protein